MHAGGLAEKHFHRHVDGIGFARTLDEKISLFSNAADDGIGAALAPAEGVEAVKPGRIERDHVALLRFVAPDFQGRHAGLFNRNLREVEARALP